MKGDYLPQAAYAELVLYSGFDLTDVDLNGKTDSSDYWYVKDRLGFAGPTPADVWGPLGLGMPDGRVDANDLDAVFNVLSPQEKAKVTEGSVDAKGFEGFETGDLKKFPWETYGGIITSPAPWTVVSTRGEAHSGTYCAKAVNDNKGGNSYLDITLTCRAGEIKFWRKLSCSYNWGLQFFIDGVQQASWGQQQPWAQVSYPVAEGTHTFRWFYKQDQEISSGEAAWIDDVEFPVR